MVEAQYDRNYHIQGGVTMTSIAYIGIDVHTTNYTLCAFTLEGQKVFGQTSINPDMSELLKYLSAIQLRLGSDYKLICGYEAGCLGYTLYHQLTYHKYQCVILAPTTMPSTPKEIKTDKRDALKIAKCLAYGTYSSVYVPSNQDNAVKEFIRMRDDAQTLLKQTKQQINAICLRHGYIYAGKSSWTSAHLKWLRSIHLDNPILQETLSEYLATYQQLADKVERLDRRIEEFAQMDAYRERVNQLMCFKGVKTHTALSFLVEIGDFQRFPTAGQFASFLGLVPGEHSSGDSRHQGGITKAGNSHLRKLLSESANCYSRVRVGKKSADLKKRQSGNTPEVIAYADKANDRLRRKYVRICTRSKANIAKTAVARELACFIWGMMNGKLDSI